MKVCIFGAGSVGVHYARAWSKRNAQVSVFDISADALERFRSEIWPRRYGEPIPKNVEPRMMEDLKRDRKSFDVVVVGTPPTSHAELAEMAVESELAEFVSIQKPVCTPDLDVIQSFLRLEALASDSGATLISGYNHRYSKAFKTLLAKVQETSRPAEVPISIEVNWLESWDGIMRAHHWLTSPADSYLGYTNQGGGALFEHSHGLDLGLFLWREIGAAIPLDYDAKIEWSKSGEYDVASSISMHSSCVKLTVSQDVTSNPPIKSASISGSDWSIRADFSADADSLTVRNDSESNFVSFPKNREADFDSEVRAVEALKFEEKNENSYMLRRLTDFSLALDSSIVGASAIKLSQGNFVLANQLFQIWSNRQSLRKI